jgi:hypothetical protein
LFLLKSGAVEPLASAVAVLLQQQHPKGYLSVVVAKVTKRKFPQRFGTRPRVIRCEESFWINGSAWHFTAWALNAIALLLLLTPFIYTHIDRYRDKGVTWVEKVIYRTTPPVEGFQKNSLGAGQKISLMRKK